jgi:hypothetical protein
MSEKPKKRYRVQKIEPDQKSSKAPEITIDTGGVKVTNDMILKALRVLEFKAYQHQAPLYVPVKSVWFEDEEEVGQQDALARKKERAEKRKQILEALNRPWRSKRRRK